MKAISIEVVSNFLTTYSHCTRCEVIFRESGLGKEANRGDIQDYPAELKEEILKLSDRLGELKQLYKHRIDIRLTDAQSPRGHIQIPHTSSAPISGFHYREKGCLYRLGS